MAKCGLVVKNRRLWQKFRFSVFSYSTKNHLFRFCLKNKFEKTYNLLKKFEGKLEQYRGNLLRSAVELAKDWRTDKLLRRLEALLIVADKDQSLIISGNGDVIEPDDGVVAIGSGGPYALAAAKALVKYSNLDARAIAEEAMTIAASICVYTNNEITIEEL